MQASGTDVFGFLVSLLRKRGDGTDGVVLKLKGDIFDGEQRLILFDQ